MADAVAHAVLVVEDERDLARVHEEWLEHRYDVRVAHDGESALEELDATVEVVVLDRVTLGCSGEAVLDHDLEHRYGCRVTVVSFVEPDFDVIEMGFGHYVVKPVDRDELVDAVEKLRGRNAYTDLVQEYSSLAWKKGCSTRRRPRGNGRTAIATSSS